ncbi:hypothetical protein Plhal304r1_c025g0084501 [Plasmopara halstedii]
MQPNVLISDIQIQNLSCFSRVQKSITRCALLVHGMYLHIYVRRHDLGLRQILV